MSTGTSRQHQNEKPPTVEHRGPLRVGRYLIVSRLGRGGMGMVYRGLDETLEREVAVKTLTAEGTLDDENRARFEIEAKAAAKLQHPNIVTVFELGEDRGIPYIAMEILPGSDLETLVRSGEAIPLAERLDILIQVCRGLAFAHEHKVVHRDIKPSNIRLLDAGVVKIMDFGIAKLAGTNVTRTGMLVGTMNYMSPEQIHGVSPDGRSDVFSAGVMLFQLLAGRRPFVGSGPDVLFRIIQDATPALGVDLGVQTPRLQEIVERALAKDVEARYQSAAHLADDLQRLQQKLAPPPALTAAQQEAITEARRALMSGHLDEALGKIEPVLAEQPEAVDARRVVRAIRREQQRRAQPPEAESELFPELEATYRAQATQRSPETVTAEKSDAEVSPTRVLVPAARGILAVGGAVLASALLIGGLVLGRSSKPLPAASAEPAGTTVTTSATTSATTPKQSLGPGPPPAPKPALAPRPALVRLKVETDPAGAALTLDGAKLGVSPAEIEIDPTRQQKLQASMEGHATQEVVLAAGKTPPALLLALEPTGLPGSLAVLSSYPVDVVWRGRVLAKAQLSPRVSLPPGRHGVTILAPGHFLKKEAVLDMKSGATLSLDTPPLGRISIKANPDNCEVFIDGVFVDYPPILDRAIVDGPHTVSFKWPDGVKREEAVVAKAGQIAYVTGRRD